MIDIFVKVILDIHAYVGENLCDEAFDDAPFYGINGAEVVVPLRDKRGYIFDFYYDRTTTLEDVVLATKKEIYGTSAEEVLATIHYSFISGNDRYFVNNGKTKLANVIDKYLDPQKTGTITVNVLLSFNAGVVDKDNELRYYVNSKESGSHHKPHIHVRDVGYNYNASVLIENGEIVAGKLPSKLAKKAKERILEKQEFFYECWNTYTDGLTVDINKHFNYINY